MKRIEFHNSDKIYGWQVAKTILAGCYKFGGATLMRTESSTMTSIIEIYET